MSRCSKRRALQLALSGSALGSAARRPLVELTTPADRAFSSCSLRLSACAQSMTITPPSPAPSSPWSEIPPKARQHKDLGGPATRSEQAEQRRFPLLQPLIQRIQARSEPDPAALCSTGSHQDLSALMQTEPASAAPAVGAAALWSCRVALCASDRSTLFQPHPAPTAAAILLTPSSACC